MALLEGDWIADFTGRARATGDAERLRLVALLRAGYASTAREPKRALALFEEGRELARRLGEPWWVLNFQAWKVHQLVHFSRDFRQAVDLAVAAALEARKPTYDGCPIQTRVYQDLLAVSFCTDPEGHASHIEEGFRYLDATSPGDFEARLRQLNLCRWWAEQSRQIERHYAAAQRALALVADDPRHYSSVHYSMFIYNGLCRVHFARGEWSQLGEAAALAEENSRKTGNQVERAMSLLWACLHAFHAGDEVQARGLRQRGVRVMDNLGVPPPDGYFESLSSSHECVGDLDAALAVRNRELSLLQAQGRTISEVYCHRERCRLLAVAGRLTAADLEAGRIAARRLRFPETYLAELDRLAR
jgi:hypothetical protein